MRSRRRPRASRRSPEPLGHFSAHRATLGVRASGVIDAGAAGRLGGSIPSPSIFLVGRCTWMEARQGRRMTEAPTEETRSGGVAAAISNLTVHLLSEYTGRGPTKARTHLSGDLVAVVLQDTMTKGERSLIRDGEHDRVLETRQAYQRTMRADLAGGVAELTGREVIAFMSANHIDPDIAAEIFVLEPQ